MKRARFRPRPMSPQASSASDEGSGAGAGGPDELRLNWLMAKLPQLAPHEIIV